MQSVGTRFRLKASSQALGYFQISQIDDRWSRITLESSCAEGPPLAQVASVRQHLGRYQRPVGMYETQTMEQIILPSVAGSLFSMIVLGSFLAVALLPACVEIYGVVTYLVAQPTHDIGVRIAWGGSSANITNDFRSKYDDGAFRRG